METLDAIWTWLKENHNVINLLIVTFTAIVAGVWTVFWTVFKWKARRAPQPEALPAPSRILQRQPSTRPLLLRWWSDRKALRRYLDRLVEEHQYFTFLGRDKPLDLEKIYIALKVGKYVPPREKPEEPAARSGEKLADERSGTVEAPEALLLDPPRLVVLSEPGGGKTTLLKHIALRIAHRDPAFGEFARKRVPNAWALLADRIQKRLARVNFFLPSFLCIVASSLAWERAHLSSPNPWFALAAGIALLIMMFLVFVRANRRVVRVCSALIVALLICFGVTQWMPSWAVGSVAAALFALWYPYWIEPLLAGLRWLRDRLTRYPLPLYLTLNDLAGSDEALEDHLARSLEEATFSDARAFLRCKLKARECLVLLDGLDEVVDEAVRSQVAERIVQAQAASRNPMLVTCRIAAFEGHSLGHRFQGFRRMEVQEFKDKEIELFIQNWFADRPSGERQERVGGLLGALGRSPRMRLLAANPLLLSLIALVYERNWKLPERRVELYDECADVLLEEWDNARGLETQARFDRATKRTALQCLAARFHQEGVRQFTQEDLRKALDVALPRPSAARHDEFLQELMERSGLIRQKSKTTYDFAHLTFQEYFVAKDFDARGDSDGLLAHLGDPWWREVILLFVGLQRDATDLLERLRGHDLLVAGAALADAQPVKTEAFVRVAHAIVDELKGRIETDSGRRQGAADVLAELQRPEAREYLVEKAREEGQPEVALAAVLALGRAADRAMLDRMWPEFGPTLRLLHGGLGRADGELRERILLVLERLGFPLVFIPAGEFVMGEDQARHRIHLGDYWIGKYLVTNAQFERFVNETKYQGKQDWRSEFTPGKERHPVKNVTWYDALVFCKWAGVTLPSEAEWEKAARGTDGLTYPWGNQWDTGRCNVAGRGTTPVDQYPNGMSPYGCSDMAGNVQEWTRSHYKEYPYDPDDGREVLDAPDSVGRVLRGGSDRYSKHGVRCAYRNWIDPGHRYDYVGFRVVASPFTSGP